MDNRPPKASRIVNAAENVLILPEFSADGFQIIVAVKAGFVAVGEGEGDGVASDDLPCRDADTRKFCAVIAADFLSKQVALARSLGAGGPGAEAFHGVVVFAAVIPTDGNFVAYGLDVGRGEHG